MGEDVHAWLANWRAKMNDPDATRLCELLFLKTARAAMLDGELPVSFLSKDHCVFATLLRTLATKHP